MVVHIKRLTDDYGYERIGTVEDGEVIDGGDEIERLIEIAEAIPSDEESIEDILVDRHNGPYLIAGYPS